VNKYRSWHICHEKQPLAAAARTIGETVEIDIAVVLFPDSCLFVGKTILPSPSGRSAVELADKSVNLGRAACATACQYCVKDGNIFA
jgi:hypothetical protein